MKRMTAFVLIVLMLLAGCSEGAGPEEKVPAAEETETASPLTEETEETEEARASVPDHLPDTLDFEGLSVPILYRGGVDEVEIYVEELNGEIVDDAIYNRNLSVSERLNIVYEYHASGNGTAQNFPDEVKNSILSNVDDYSILSWAQYSTLPLCLQDMIMDISDAKYLDYDMPWWNQEYMDTLQIGSDKRFFLMGDINLNALKVTAAMFFNQRIYEDFYGDPNELYQTVLEGEWTIDLLYDKSNAAWGDLNGDGKKNNGDIFGIAATTVANTELFAYGLGLNVVGRDEEGLPVLVVQEQHNYDIMDKLNQLYWNNDGMTTQYGDGDAFNGTAVSNMFASDQLLFMPLWMKTCESLRDMESSYGILPYPKYDENQENYISLVQDTSSIFCVPVTCLHPDEISAVLEAMCAENYRTVIPAYYDVALKSKYTRDELSAAMIDLIHDTSMTDFAYAYNYSIGSIGTVMRGIVQQNGNMASTVSKQVKVVTKSLEKVIRAYLENGG
ncbi:MAG: hypothetical protein ACI4V1_08125 [Eubacteriales bacterium]